MKLRQSDMPDEAYWETLLDVLRILARLHIGAGLHDVEEQGCGSGTFSLAVARAIRGTLHAFDINAAVVNRTREHAAESGIGNLVCEQRDVSWMASVLSRTHRTAVFCSTCSTAKRPVRVFQEAARVINRTGSIFVIHWL